MNDAQDQVDLADADAVKTRLAAGDTKFRKF